MNIFSYFKDKSYIFLFYLFINILILLFSSAFKIKLIFTIIIIVLTFIFLITTLLIEYFKKRRFYSLLKKNISQLDKAYLVLETLDKPTFYEGLLLWDFLYDINKSMCEQINFMEEKTNDFKEYIEMWIHEVKIPIASLILITHNSKNDFKIRIKEQLKRIEDCVEQVLYYVRAENASSDYYINEVNLQKVIQEVALKNKDDLLEHNIEFLKENVSKTILTDSKWLVFIINQIINNSIKYHDKSKKSFIKVSVLEENKIIKLYIIDNGIGIKENDLPRVFDKTFTGYNGRGSANSTGMGLFIVKNLCEKLGHKIEITSEEGKGTTLVITFFLNTHYDVVRHISKL